MADPVRVDVRVPNESDGFVFTTEAARGRGLMPGTGEWRAAVAACHVLPLAVESEDDAVVRVVLGGPLLAAESEEWVGRLDGSLRIPDGRLALCGGLDYLLEGGDDGWVRIVPVPPGDYRVTVYCYASAPNGRLCVEEAGGREELGAWFRRTRPDQPMPAWLHNRCVDDPSLDPGFQRAWRRAQWRPGGDVVDFLLHLEPAAGTLVAAATDESGFASAGQCRRVEPFPLGIAALLPAEDVREADHSAPEPLAEVAAPAQRFALQTIAGGPVEVPLVKLARVFRVAWMCQAYTVPELRIELPGKGRLEVPGEVDIVDIRTLGRLWTFSFEDRGQRDEAPGALAALARGFAEVPDGSRVELDAARPRHAQGDRPPGLHRYRGVVQGGNWRIAEAFPPVDAATLAEALSLAALAEGPRVLTARDEAEAERILERVQAHAADFFVLNPLTRAGATISLARRDPAAMLQVALRAFRLRYASVWPLHDEDLEG